MSVLFESVKIGNFETRNRFVRSATYFVLADDEGFIGEPSVMLMKKLAEGSVGLIIPSKFTLSHRDINRSLKGAQT